MEEGKGKKKEDYREIASNRQKDLPMSRREPLNDIGSAEVQGSGWGT